ncbi:MAG TPA: spore germination protein GerW family protein [Bryobacteraceae bacterium]|nr:spore germination protein GerW family protein [Bryobacteraceae bacterium]
MELQAVLGAMVNQAGTKTVYSEPVTVNGHTIVPVARVRCGFGGGSGRNGRSKESEGGGGGGGFVARPVGFVEVDAKGARFVPILDPQSIAMGVGLGMGLGWALGRLLFRK